MSSASSVQTFPVVSQLVPISQLSESSTNPRKHFDPACLMELTASVKEDGVLQPLLVRPHPNGKGQEFEIVAGARRYRAARLAGVKEVPVSIREFTDEAMAYVQLIENGQREDLGPIEEAEAYAALAAKGLTIAKIAERLKKKPSHVARRLPLAKLPTKVKEVMASGILPVLHAEAIARIPDQKLQEAALSRILEDFGLDEKPILGVKPLMVVKRIIEEEFMTDLAVAIFDPEDAGLSPLGACSKCPYLSGNDRDLFGDIKGRSVCTNAKDFHLKTENHLRRLKDNGCVVLLSKKELARAFPQEHDANLLSREFIDLGKVCREDPKGRTYDALLGKVEKLKTIYALKHGKVRRLYPASQLRNALAGCGHEFAKKPGVKKGGKDANAGAVILSRRIKEAVAVQLVTKLRSAKLKDQEWWDLIARAIILAAWNLEPVFRRHGYSGTSEEFAKHREKVIAERFGAMKMEEKRAIAIDFVIDRWGDELMKREQQLFYAEVLKRMGVDKTAIAKRIVSEAKLDKNDARANQRESVAVPAKARTLSTQKEKRTK